MTAATRPQYGNFRPTRRAGLFGVPVLALGALLAASTVGFALLISQHWPAALGWTVLTVALTAPLLHRDAHDRNTYQNLGVRISFMLRRKAGATVYRSGPAGSTPDGKCRLPGLAAASVLAEHTDAYGQPFALLYVPATHHYSIVLGAAPADHQLMDESDIDQLVATWGGWLADLGHHPSVDGASVTVETAPDSGLTLRRNISTQLASNAPAFSTVVLGEIAQTFPALAARVTTRVTVTFSGIPPWERGSALRRKRPKPRSRDEMATEIANLLPGLIAGLAATGAGTAVRALRAQDVVDETKVAYNPAVAQQVEEARQSGGTDLTWEEAGPTGAVESWTSYRHDLGWSQTWYMTCPHRGAFPAEALSRLLGPHRDIVRKRVTILYRPEPPAAAAEIVDRAYRDATSEASQRGRATARQLRAIRVAERTAAEEAGGAGLLRFGVIVTATVLDPALMPLAQTTVEGLAAAPRLKLRLAYGNQAAAFATGLPLGLVLPKHLVLSSELRDQLL
jgi:hypothetical protein